MKKIEDINREIIKNIKLNNIKGIQVYINNNINLNEFKISPLTIACKYGHIKIVKLLLNNGADVNLQQNYALTIACRYGHIKIVKLLLNKCAEPKTRQALFSACSKGHFEIVKLLFKYGANLHAGDGYALTCASRYGHFKIVKFLLDKKVYIEPNLISIVKKRGHTDVENLLHEYTNKNVSFIRDYDCPCGYYDKNKHKESLYPIMHYGFCSMTHNFMEEADMELEEYFFNPKTKKYERLC